MKFNRKKYMKTYNKLYQRALGALRKRHLIEFTGILLKMMKGGNDGKNN